MLRLTIFALCGLATFFLATPAHADLTLEADSTKIVIEGTLDGQTTSFTRTVTLTARGGAATEVRLRAPDLVLQDDSSVIIDRSNISLVGGVALPDGRPRDIRITISNVTRPGTYKPRDGGLLRFDVVANQTEVEALTLPIEVQMKQKPVLAIEKTPKPRLVHCREVPLIKDLDCALARVILPSSSDREKWEVVVNNQTLTAVKLKDVVVVAEGERNGEPLDSGVTIDIKTALPASRTTKLVLDLKPQDMSADLYKGKALIYAEGLDQPLSVDLDIALREGPLIPLLVIVLGVVFGRIAADLAGPKAQLQKKLMDLQTPLYSRANAISNASAEEWAKAQLAESQRKINRGTQTEEEVKKLETAIELLIQLDTLDEKMQSRKEQIEKARGKVISFDFEGAATEIAALQKIRGEEMGSRSDEASGILAASVAAATDLADVSRMTSGIVESGLRRVASAVFAVITGFPSGSARYWIARPVVYIAGIVVLIIIGMKSLYVDSVDLGAGAIYDYLPLLLWGLGADIAGRSLLNLPALGGGNNT